MSLTTAAKPRTRAVKRPRHVRANGLPPQKKLSRQHKPADMSLEQWQTELRRQFGREQKFQLQNTGGAPVFSEFQVLNPESRGTYRVVIRGRLPGDNFCGCADFATNTLGTCKHIEFVLAKLERKRGARAALRAGFQPAHSEIVLKYGAQREVRFLAGTDCPPALAALAAEYFGPDRTLRPEAFGHFEKFLAQASRFGHDLRCYDDTLAFIAEVRDAGERRRRIDEGFPKGIASPAFDKLLKVNLYDYQRQGALFAARAGRCLIGDEMGLGKTIQAIAAVEIMARRLGVSRVLIVCPTSLKHQWEREIANFSGRPACVINGLRARRAQLFGADAFFKITNYDTIHKDLDLIAAWAPDVVILDEAQRIKNWNTRTARSVKKIDTPYALVLTGTPLENRLEELVSIVEFVDRYRLGPTFRFLHDHQLLDEFGKVVGYRDLDSIGKTLEPILIRRRKDQVLKQLPGRLDKNFFVAMTPEQMVHHEENREVVARVVAKWRKLRFLSEADKTRLMIALQNMRMSCNSTYLLDQTTDFGFKCDELATLLDELYERPETKVVIFSQWVRTHELLQRRLKARGYGHVLFHGGVPGAKRGDLIERFRQESQCRAFLSTDAGGVGLNLQHASVVVNMDLPWNPAVLEQRIGRVHRLGQSRPVQVVNFVSQGTIEEGMLSVLKFKKSLFAGALDGGENEVFLGGSRLTRFMETVEKASGSIPAVAVEDVAARTEAAAESTTAEAPVEDAGGDDSVKAAAGTRASGVGAGVAGAGGGSDVWAGLLQTGLSLLEQLAATARSGASGNGSKNDGVADRKAPAGLSIVRHDPKTGAPYLHLPVPSPDVLDRILSAAGELLKGLRR
jgi:superfamily II DNA or RNA helicase